MSGVASCVDPAGATASVAVSSYSDLLETFSRLRSFKLHSSIKKSTLRMDYRGWIMQCTPQAFLQTIDPAMSSERVFYPTGSVNTAPVLRFSYQIVLGSNVSSRSTLGIFRVNAKMTVRGRRGLPTQQVTPNMYSSYSLPALELLHQSIERLIREK